MNKPVKCRGCTYETEWWLCDEDDCIKQPEQLINKMPALSEGQFHTVWTEAVGRKGYDKHLFQSILIALKEKGEILSSKEVSSV